MSYPRGKTHMPYLFIGKHIVLGSGRRTRSLGPGCGVGTNIHTEASTMHKRGKQQEPHPPHRTRPTRFRCQHTCASIAVYGRTGRTPSTPLHRTAPGPTQTLMPSTHTKDKTHVRQKPRRKQHIRHVGVQAWSTHRPFSARRRRHCLSGRLTFGFMSSRSTSMSLEVRAYPRPCARPEAKKRMNCTNLLRCVGRMLSSNTSRRDCRKQAAKTMPQKQPTPCRVPPTTSTGRVEL